MLPAFIGAAAVLYDRARTHPNDSRSLGRWLSEEWSRGERTTVRYTSAARVRATINAVNSVCRARGGSSSISVNSVFQQLFSCIIKLLCLCVSFVFQSPTAASVSSRVGLTTGRQSRTSGTLMILPQVHLRKPCYDFYFL